MLDTQCTNKRSNMILDLWKEISCIVLKHSHITFPIKNIHKSCPGVDFINWFAPYAYLLLFGPNFCTSKKLLKSWGQGLKVGRRGAKPTFCKSYDWLLYLLHVFPCISKNSLCLVFSLISINRVKFDRFGYRANN